MKIIRFIHLQMFFIFYFSNLHTINNTYLHEKAFSHPFGHYALLFRSQKADVQIKTRK